MLKHVSVVFSFPFIAEEYYYVTVWLCQNLLYPHLD